ncbi:MAG: hypothetical protein AABY79_07850 [Nitrospirota bacterium]|jgi:hypothetical protein
MLPPLLCQYLYIASPSLDNQKKHRCETSGDEKGQNSYAKAAYNYYSKNDIFKLILKGLDDFYFEKIYPKPARKTK